MTSWFLNGANAGSSTPGHFATLSVWSLGMTSWFLIGANAWQPVSEELAGGKVANEAAVGSQKVISRQIFELYPLDLVEDLVFDLAVECVHRIELQVHGASVTVVVANVGDMLTDDGGDAQLFVEFTAERLFRSLAGFNLAAREFPLKSHWLVGPSLANEQFAVAAQESCCDKPKSWSGRARIGTRLRVFHATSLNGSNRLDSDK